LPRTVRVSKCVGCKDFPCNDVRHECYAIPDIEVSPSKISIAVVSEAAPENPNDYYYSKGNPLFQQTTVQAFKDAGIDVSSIDDLVNMGVFFTTAVKCGKIGYSVGSDTINRCSFILEKELDLFPNLRVLLLMGDVAIRALNEIARRGGEHRVIPAGSTYKVRSDVYHFRGKRVFPSYLQAGPSFFIEKSKRRMIAQDIAAAMKLV